jgi:hypothetical protein
MCGVHVGKIDAGETGAAVGVGDGDVAGTSTGAAGAHGWTELTQFAGSNGPAIGRASGNATSATAGSTAVAVSTATSTAVRGEACVVDGGSCHPLPRRASTRAPSSLPSTAQLNTGVVTLLLEKVVASEPHV